MTSPSTKYRILAMLLSAALLLSLLVLPAGAAELTDTADHWAEDVIDTWVGHGVLTGYPDGSFGPDNRISRAELAKLLNAVVGYQSRGSAVFVDVPADAWYADAVLKLATAGVMQGDAGLARPEDPVTRQEAVVLIGRAFAVPEAAAGSFADEPAIADWARGLVGGMQAAGYVQGSGGNHFNPADSITRAEVVKLLDNLIAEYHSAAGSVGGDEARTVSGNVVVNASGVTLKNLVIEGSLYLMNGIGEGDFDGEGLQVAGTTYVWGGGQNTVRLSGVYDQIVIDGDRVHVVLDGSVETLSLAGGTLDLAGVTVSELVIPAGATVNVGADSVIRDAIVEQGGALNVNDGGRVEQAELRGGDMKVERGGEAGTVVNTVGGGTLTNNGTIGQVVGADGSVDSGGPGGSGGESDTPPTSSPTRFNLTVIEPVSDTELVATFNLAVKDDANLVAANFAFSGDAKEAGEWEDLVIDSVTINPENSRQILIEIKEYDITGQDFWFGVVGGLRWGGTITLTAENLVSANGRALSRKAASYTVPESSLADGTVTYALGESAAIVPTADELADQVVLQAEGNTHFAFQVTVADNFATEPIKAAFCWNDAGWWADMSAEAVVLELEPGFNRLEVRYTAQDGSEAFMTAVVVKGTMNTVLLMPQDGVPSLGTAGDGKITGLTAGTCYVLYVDGEIHYVKADGSVSDRWVDLAPLTGTEITGLENGGTKTYFVREAYADFEPVMADHLTLSGGKLTVDAKQIPNGDVAYAGWIYYFMDFTQSAGYKILPADEAAAVTSVDALDSADAVDENTDVGVGHVLLVVPENRSKVVKYTIVRSQNSDIATLDEMGIYVDGLGSYNESDEVGNGGATPAVAETVELPEIPYDQQTESYAFWIIYDSPYATITYKQVAAGVGAPTSDAINTAFEAHYEAEWVLEAEVDLADGDQLFVKVVSEDGKVTRFYKLVVSLEAAPEPEPEAAGASTRTVGPGSAVGSFAVSAGEDSDVCYVHVADEPLLSEIPNAGNELPIGLSIDNPIAADTASGDVAGVVGQWVEIFEVDDSDNTIVAYGKAQLTNDNLKAPAVSIGEDQDDLLAAGTLAGVYAYGDSAADPDYTYYIVAAGAEDITDVDGIEEAAVDELAITSATEAELPDDIEAGEYVVYVVHTPSKTYGVSEESFAVVEPEPELGESDIEVTAGIEAVGNFSVTAGTNALLVGVVDVADENKPELDEDVSTLIGGGGTHVKVLAEASAELLGVVGQYAEIIEVDAENKALAYACILLAEADLCPRDTALIAEGTVVPNDASVLEPEAGCSYYYEKVVDGDEPLEDVEAVEELPELDEDGAVPAAASADDGEYRVYILHDSFDTAAVCDEPFVLDNTAPSFDPDKASVENGVVTVIFTEANGLFL
ncbi:MAG: S-layer homology domain-containing protein, partial [Clostridiales bacterium]|nr:S-layer homology domain-containing protein [Clostridiales bacterium]